MRQALGFAPEEPTAAVFVRVPERQAQALDRLSFELKQPKRAIVSALLSILEGDEGLLLGRADTGARGLVAPDVLDTSQVAALLDVDERDVLELAEGGELPGRKIGDRWRFSRSAVLGWLACNQA
jgi:excisionase family DNA binding protein